MKGKRTSHFLITVLATALVFLVGFFCWWRWAMQPVSPTTSPFVFVIQKGESLDSISKRLSQEKLVRSGLAFKIMAVNQGLANQIQAGDFRLSPSQTPKEIAETLTHGALDIWLTFPEGWRREEFARRLTANLENFDQVEFLNLTRDKEGFLFPDTYLIPQDAEAAKVLALLENNFNKKFHRDLETATEESGLSRNEAIILASIVEREAGSDQDRPLVAGILLKRWQNDWPLQADATMQYALGSQRCQVTDQTCDYWQPVKKSELETDSAYNTYKNKGLPPTPICNPGLAAIEAVVYPEASDYWFYLADSQGRTHYAITNEEHNQNISQYLR